ncbi:MAG: carboxypeptidase regulatory-like domain-containing protein [bacterium]
MMVSKLTRSLLTSVVAIALCLVLTGTTSQAAPSEGGSISGTITFKAKAPPPTTIKVDKDIEVCGTHEKYSEELIVSKTGGLMNVVVQVVGAKGEITIPKGKDRPSLTQKGCQFTPHVQVVPAGTRINVLNEDGIAHNIHSLSVDNPSFNQQQPGAKKRIVTKKNDFSVPEIIPMKCDIHGWMKAWIVVADHPYTAISNEKGAFKISGIPAGTYTVEFWHETLGKQSQEVAIKDGADTEINVAFEPGK